MTAASASDRPETRRSALIWKPVARHCAGSSKPDFSGSGLHNRTQLGKSVQLSCVFEHIRS